MEPWPLPLSPRDEVRAWPGPSRDPTDLAVSFSVSASVLVPSLDSSGSGGRSLSVSGIGCGSSCSSEISVSCEAVARRDLESMLDVLLASVPLLLYSLLVDAQRVVMRVSWGSAVVALDRKEN